MLCRDQHSRKVYFSLNYPQFHFLAAALFWEKHWSLREYGKVYLVRQVQTFRKKFLSPASG